VLIVTSTQLNMHANVRTRNFNFSCALRKNASSLHVDAFKVL